MQARDFAIWTCPLNRSRLTVHQPLRVVDVKGGLSDAPAGAHSRAPLHHGCVGSARRPYFPSFDEVGAALTDHYGGGVGVGAYAVRHHRRVGHPQALDALDLQVPGLPR